MHKPEKIFTSKNTAYFDHNVLDNFLKYPEIALFKDISMEHQVVYSDEILREIRRSVGGENNFLDALVELNAMHIRIFFDENFDATGEAVLSAVNPYEAYEQLCRQESLVEKLNSSTQSSLRKFYGDTTFSKFDELSDQGGEAFQNVLADLVKTVAEHPTTDLELLMRLKGYAARTLASQIEAQRQTSAMMQRYRGDGEASSVSVYRNSVGIGPKQLNNVSYPNVIEKLWALHKPLPGYRDMGYSVDDFLGISYLAPGLSGVVTDFQKIIAAYNVLNIIGYHNDSGLKHTHRFTSSMSDATHVAYASFTDFLYSSDKGLLSKASAIYEFLNLKTKVCRLRIVDNRRA